ncbi:TolB family protein [Ekhidna sp.]|uniref:TolB family protein n=1 Tax=Ekhidna sp. TaxID=2608089 RepID=UPI003CCBEE85
MNRWIIIIFAWIAISCGSSKETSNEVDTKQEILLYLSVRNKNYDIYKNDLKGSETMLTTNPGFDYAPNWNQQLNKVIYYSYVNDSFLIDAKNLDGEDVPLDTYNQTEFNLSPNGELLIHQVQNGDFSTLILSDLEGLSMDTITNEGSYNGRAKWSYESNKIAYISDRDGNNEVYVYDLNDSTTQRITINESFEKYITWEPGGKRLAYTTQFYEEGSPDRNDVFIYDFDRRVKKQITFNDFNDTELAWSPIK